MVTTFSNLAKLLYEKHKPPGELQTFENKELRRKLAKEWAGLEEDPFKRLEILYEGGLIADIEDMAKAGVIKLSNYRGEPRIEPSIIDRTYEIARAAFEKTGNKQGKIDLGNALLEVVKVGDDSPYTLSLLQKAIGLYRDTDSIQYIDDAFSTVAEKARTDSPNAYSWLEQAIEIGIIGENYFIPQLVSLLLEIRNRGGEIRVSNIAEVSQHVKPDDMESIEVLGYFKNELREERTTAVKKDLQIFLKVLNYRPIGEVRSGIGNLQTLIRRGKIPFSANDYVREGEDDDTIYIVHFGKDGTSSLALYQLSRMRINDMLENKKRKNSSIQPSYKGENALEQIIADLESIKLF